MTSSTAMGRASGAVRVIEDCVPDALPERAVLLDHVAPQDRRAAGVGFKQRHENAEEGCLAAAIRADETEQLAGGHGE